MANRDGHRQRGRSGTNGGLDSFRFFKLGKPSPFQPGREPPQLRPRTHPGAGDGHREGGHAALPQHRLWVKTVLGSHFGWSVIPPPILEPIQVGIGMFTGGRFGFGPMARWVLTFDWFRPPKYAFFVGACKRFFWGVGRQNIF